MHPPQQVANNNIVDIVDTAYLFMSSASTRFNVLNWRQNKLSAHQDTLAEEVPVALVYNGISHAVMLATPQDLEDFALGFSLTEGILDNPEQLYSVDVIPQANGIEVQMEIATEAFARLKSYRRNMTGRTGCGLCGTESLQHAIKPLKHNRKMNALKPNIHAVLGAFKQLSQHQVIQKATGATHACAVADVEGNIVLSREDVGRHNALDKLVGAFAKSGLSTPVFAITTSRASYEMVQKTASAGIPLLAAISAPTALAVRMAEDYGLTLVGFARDDQCVVYAHAERLSA